MKRIADKCAVVTGAASGIGFAAARLLAREGAKVALADRDEKTGLKAREQIEAETGAEVIYVKLDVSSEALWSSAVAQVSAKFGGIDILVNNAGIYLLGTTESTTLDDWEKTFSVNVRGVFLGCRAVIPVMRRGGGGSIVNISSNFGLVAFPGSAAYVASKGAVRMLTKATASEVAEDGIRVNSVHPALTETNMVRGVLEDPVIRSKLVDRAPLKRAAKPEEIADAILFLSSEKSSFVTGSELVVDGGYTAV